MLRFLDAHLEEVIGSIMLAVMATVAFVNVIVRYCTSFSFAWTEEITVNFFVWVVLLGSSCCFRDGSHLRMTLLYNFLPRQLRIPVYFFGVVVCIIFFAALAYMGTLEVIDEMDLEVTSESMEIPEWWYTICTPLLSVLIIFRLLQSTAGKIKSGNF